MIRILLALALLCAAPALAVAQSGSEDERDPISGAPRAPQAGPARDDRPIGGAGSAGPTLPAKNAASLELISAQFDLVPGQVIGRHVGAFLHPTCGHNNGADPSWDPGFAPPGAVLARELRLRLAGIGYSVIEHSQPYRETPFGQFAIHLKVKSVALDLCRHFVFLASHLTTGWSGNATVEVEWTIVSRATEREIFRGRSRGRGEVPGDQRSGNPIPLILVRAIGSAAQALAADQAFYNAMADTKSAVGAAPPTQPGTGGAARLGPAERATGAATPGSGLDDSPLAIHGVGPRNGLMSGGAKDVAAATFVIGRHDAHGSGFFISSDGYALTNFHVVGDLPEVNLILGNGREVLAKVVRVDRLRDIALIKAPVQNVRALAIRRSPAQIAEEVYAIGAPLERANSGTVTRGIVSALRDGPHGPLIQADASILGGNSGGPLVDARGNVVGVAMARRRTIDSATATPFNYFIPVLDALHALDVTLR